MLEANKILRERYRIEKQIGKGGMGAVYKATDLTFNSTVALKETIVDGDEARVAFEREAKILNKLRHAALPVVMDYFFEDDNQYLVMQFIPGDDLLALFGRNGNRAFPLAKVTDWGLQLLGALQFLHEHEPPIVHRDIKPQNIKQTPNGELVLLDFGLAKGVGTGKTVSGVGSIMGYTPNYAPFEQIQGTGTDPRSDLFSLAATMYHLLTGIKPIDAMTRGGAVMAKKPDPLPPCADINGSIPASISDLIQRTLSLNADDRPASAREMLAELKDAAANAPEPSQINEGDEDSVATVYLSESALEEGVGSVAPTSKPIVAPTPSLPVNTAQGVVPPESATSLPSIQPQVFATETAPRASKKTWIIAAAVLFVAAVGIGLWMRSRSTNIAAHLPPPAVVSFAFNAATVDANGRVTTKKSVGNSFLPDFGPGVTIQMIEIPAGSVLIGSPLSEAGRQSDEPEAEAEQVAQFFLSRYEVTQANWRAAATGLPKVNIDLNPDPSKFKGDDLPVDDVSWEECMEFCARLSAYTGRNYTLPTWIQWEYACRAGSKTPFAFGETLSADLANYDASIAYGKGPTGPTLGKTRPATKDTPANAFGLSDMHGNVWEWCETEYKTNAHSADGDDATVPADKTRRVLRGGSYNSLAADCRSASRYSKQETGRADNVGFRIVLNLQQQPN